VSLLETLIALVIVGSLAAAGTTSLVRFTDRARVEAMAGTILNAYRRTQSVARAWGRPAELVVSRDSILIRALTATSSTVIWRGPGPASAGVNVSPALHVSSFAPSGLGTGAANVSHVLSRGTARRQVIVSRLGRVKVVP
jgi:type II secretory pathway pseudopilin PulG